MGTLAFVMWLGLQLGLQGGARININIPADGFPVCASSDVNGNRTGDWHTCTYFELVDALKGPPDPPETPIMKHLPLGGQLINQPAIWNNDAPRWNPILVPAIHVRDWTFNEETYYWDCEDKTRILEHDQQNPPKYWCRAEMQ